jgi:O-antigen ligase
MLLLLSAIGLSAVVLVIFLQVDIPALFGRDESLSGRRDIWEFAISYIADNKPLWGQGYMMNGGIQYEARMLNLFTQAIPGAESGYLTMILDLGIVGFSLFIVPYMLAIKNGLQWLKYLDGEERLALTFMLTLIIGALVYAITESSAFMATSFDGVICFGPLFFLLALPKSPATLIEDALIRAKSA